MSRIQLKITCLTKNQGKSQLEWEKPIHRLQYQEESLLELSDKELKAAIIKLLQQQLKILETNENKKTQKNLSKETEVMKWRTKWKLYN